MNTITIPLIIAVFFLVVAILQKMWNVTIPDIFGIREITYWEAFRLMIIAAILFGGGGASIDF